MSIERIFYCNGPDELRQRLIAVEDELERLAQVLETIATAKPGLEIGSLGRQHIEKLQGYARLALANLAVRTQTEQKQAESKP